jgi:hypothetical protein
MKIVLHNYVVEQAQFKDFKIRMKIHESKIVAMILVFDFPAAEEHYYNIRFAY